MYFFYFLIASVVNNCVLQVSLDSRVRDILTRTVGNPTTETFDEAQLQIYTLMQRDSYPRFVNSQMFKLLAKV